MLVVSFNSTPSFYFHRTVSGNLPPGKFPPIKSPPSKINVACRPKWLNTQQSFAGQVARLKYCLRLILCWNNSFLYFVQFGLLEFQRFCIQRCSCHSFNTSSFWCKYRINHCIEFITDQKFLVCISSDGVLYVAGVETTFGLWPFLIIFTKNQPTLNWKFKNDWTKDWKSC